MASQGLTGLGAWEPSCPSSILDGRLPGTTRDMASCCALGIYYSRVLYKESTLDSQLLFWNYNEQLFAILISLPFRIQIKWKKKSFRTPSWCLFLFLQQVLMPPVEPLGIRPGWGGSLQGRPQLHCAPALPSQCSVQEAGSQQQFCVHTSPQRCDASSAQDLVPQPLPQRELKSRQTLIRTKASSPFLPVSHWDIKHPRRPCLARGIKQINTSHDQICEKMPPDSPPKHQT